MRIHVRMSSYALCLALLLAFWVAPLGARDSVPMRTIEGRVLAVARHQGEGGVEVLMAKLAVPGGPESGTQILLAPESVCEQIGFQIEEGDRLRARIFVSADGPSRVQKVQNFTQGTMVRMRTLHTTPLWSATGAWQGGPIRTARGHDQAGRGSGKGPPR